MYKSHLVFVAAILTSTVALSHGDVAPQPMNTDALPDVGEEWLIENPYRNMGEDVWSTAITIGDSGYNQNCARCHPVGDSMTVAWRFVIAHPRRSYHSGLNNWFCNR